MDPDVEREMLSQALSRVARGEAAALKDVYDRTSAKLMGVCLRILREPSEAEDVLQEVYVSVWRNAAAFDRARGSPITWLATMARNRAIDRLRARSPAGVAQGGGVPIEAALAIADPAPTAETALENADRHARLDRCLGELESPHRQAIRSAFLEGHTYETLARQAGVPLGTMKSWIRRALLRLRACLQT
jgi:RNA polymerase sigma-70 factor (ECF subfamily)